VIFRDSRRPRPSDVELEALSRNAAVHDVPTPCTRAPADFKHSSPLLDEEHARPIMDFGGSLWRPERSTTT
jgi:methylglyoxal synthase